MIENRLVGKSEGKGGKEGIIFWPDGVGEIEVDGRVDGGVKEGVDERNEKNIHPIPTINHSPP